ncbi:hypothetical protein [Vibrio phage XZ1]|uniref:Uncharacterized protein n=1 Tax=Vibrio phage VH7D TaxID=1262539 RepID=V9LYQ7_9CAUD|nr:hypothetical protein CF80_gp095 [Vibrio phage VH7D]AGB06882.1 hypothetical protein [Vibrio phage VH7D]UOL51317.1 hypothetical protein [Vibrio phage XZ1]
MNIKDLRFFFRGDDAYVAIHTTNSNYFLHSMPATENGFVVVPKNQMHKYESFTYDEYRNAFSNWDDEDFINEVEWVYKLGSDILESRKEKQRARSAENYQKRKQKKSMGNDENSSQPSLNTPMGYAVALMRNDLSARELLSMHDGLASSEQMYLKHVENVTGEPRGSATIFNAKRLLKTTLRSQEISEINAEIQRLEQLKAQLANK